MSYQAIIARVSTRPHPNADKIQLGTVCGSQVVVSLDTQDGELGVYFPVDGVLSHEYCVANHLYTSTGTGVRGHLPRESLDRAAGVTEAVRSAWSAETSYDPHGWSRANPSWGQCAVTALVVQDFFGGILLCARVNGYEHYWNRVGDSWEIDLTREQFGTGSTEEGRSEASRDYVLSFPATLQRYLRLRKTVLALLAGC